MVTFVDVFKQLESLGLTDVLVPFLLIFAVVYAVLSRIKIFGTKGKNINMIVALSLSLLVVVPHVTGGYPPGKDVVVIMNNAIPNVSGVIIAIIMMMIMIGVFGVKFNLGSDDAKKFAGFVAIASALIVFFIFGRSAGWFDVGLPSWLGFLNNPDTVAVLLVLLVFGVIVWFITSSGKGTGTKLGEGISEFLENVGGILK